MDLRFSAAGLASAALVLFVAACASPALSEEAQGNTASAVSVNTDKVEGKFFLTTFGGPDDSGDNGELACGGNSDPSSNDPHQKYYAAAKQRFGCGTHIRLEANGNCIILETTDTGPAAWVEDKAGGPVIDATPLAAEELFGQSGFGWSDRAAVQLTIADANTPLGPCSASTSGGSTSPKDTPDDSTDTGDDDDDDTTPTPKPAPTATATATATPAPAPAPTCEPKTAAEACSAAKASSGAECGHVADGCKGQVSCQGQPGFGCADGQTCSKNRCQSPPAAAPNSAGPPTAKPSAAEVRPPSSAGDSASGDGDGDGADKTNSSGSDATPPKASTKSASSGCSATPTSTTGGSPQGLGLAGLAGALAFRRRRRRT